MKNGFEKEVQCTQMGTIRIRYEERGGDSSYLEVWTDNSASSSEESFLRIDGSIEIAEFFRLIDLVQGRPVPAHEFHDGCCCEVILDREFPPFVPPTPLRKASEDELKLFGKTFPGEIIGVEGRSLGFETDDMVWLEVPDGGKT